METRASGGVPFVVNENIYILFCVQLAKSLKPDGDRMPTKQHMTSGAQPDVTVLTN